MGVGLSLIFTLLLASVGLGIAYLYLLLLASLLPRAVKPTMPEQEWLRFAVAIPAHNEAAVIAGTVSTILATDYPASHLDVYVVADHCDDETARLASQAGGNVFERQVGPSGSKGAALAWLFERIFTGGRSYDAVAIFDADTRVASDFFRVMNRYLRQGAEVVQGNHVIRNPQAGWFPALTWAMFRIDNRVQNQGRDRLGLSAKNMGDAICFRAEVLQRLGWGDGLTEDYAFRQRLLLDGLRIQYASEAVAFGDAAVTWAEARAQRARWLRGVYQSSRQIGRTLLLEGLRRGNLPLLDGALQAYLPSYSTMALLTSLLMLSAWMLRPWLWSWLPAAWLSLFVLIFFYPLIGLALDRAPLKAYLIILSGPLFILWRTGLGFWARFLQRQVLWVRTPRHHA